MRGVIRDSGGSAGLLYEVSVVDRETLMILLTVPIINCWILRSFGSMQDPKDLVPHSETSGLVFPIVPPYWVEFGFFLPQWEVDVLQ